VHTTPRRKLSLTPQDTVWVQSGGSVQFSASAQGATMENLTWSLFEGASLRTNQNAKLASLAVSSSTCTNGTATCTDQVQSSYTRSVSAVVDDSLQVSSVVVMVGSLATFQPDSSCYDLDGACWSNAAPEGTDGPVYVAPQTVTRASFTLDFTDQNSNLHHFYLSNTTFIRLRIVKTTSKYVDAIYSIDELTIGAQTSNPAGETLLWARQIPIRSTLVETIPGSGNYSGGFVQNGKASGQFCCVLPP